MSKELSIEQRVHDLAIAYLTIKYANIPAVDKKSLDDPTVIIEEYSEFVRRAPEYLDIA